MRIRIPVLALIAGVLAVGCGAKKDKTTANDGGPPVDDSGYDAPPPAPGVCHRLCCSNSDCNVDETCKPFLPADGTLGVCTVGSASDAGSASDGGDASAPGGDAGLDPACWSQSPGCNPLTNARCPAGEACDVTGLVDGSVAQVECQDGQNVQSEGQNCDSVYGPFCVPGYHCVSNH